MWRVKIRLRSLGYWSAAGTCLLAGCSKEELPPIEDTSLPEITDVDDDGIPSGEDCDDNDPTLGSIEVDADCDGVLTEEDCDDEDSQSTTVANDADCDGSLTEEDCDDTDPGLNGLDADLDGMSSCDGDCDNTTSEIHPDASDGLIADRNCDGAVEKIGSLAFSDAKILGVNESDYAGVSVASAGDLNDDGLMDFLMGAPYEDEAGMGAGAVYVFLGKAAGLTGLLSADQADFVFLGESEADNAGASIAGVGDVDGDGRDDFLVGARYNAEGGPYAGAAYLVMGGSLMGEPVRSLAEADIKFVGERYHDNAGAEVSAAGDVDGDGLADVMIGAYRNDEIHEDAGAAYLFLGAGLGASVVVDLGQADFKLVGENQDDNAGFSLAAAGDVDGDGLGDVIVGARYNADGGLYAGAAYVVMGADLDVPGVMPLSEASGKLIGEESSDYAGIAVAAAGDLDDDGLDDLLIGAPGVDDLGSESGAVYGVWGSQLIATSVVDLSEAGFKISGEMEGDNAGLSMAGVGDINGDHVEDLLLGADSNDEGANQAGAAYLVSGRRLRDAAWLSLGEADHKFLGEADGDGSGLSVSGLGDVNGDGAIDLLIGSGGDDSSAINAGAAYVISGK